MTSRSQPQPPQPHTVIARLLHWGFVVLFAYGLTKQLDTVAQLEDAALLRFEMLFAAVFLAVLVMRFFYMKTTRPTALRDTAPAHMRFLARAGHLAMYASLAMIAISGMLIGTLYGVGIKAGLVMDLTVGLHEASVMASYVTIALHVAAAVYHRLKGDGIWSSMVPVWRETQSR